MTHRRAFATAGVVLVVGASLWTVQASEHESGTIMPGNVDLLAGQDLYVQHCAACHGAQLEGQPNWRSPGADGRLPAPPHDETGHTWHHSDRVLFDYTKLGGRAMMAGQGIEFNSGMPAFGAELSDRDIWNILGYIKSTWPERIRDVQAQRTAGELQD